MASNLSESHPKKLYLSSLPSKVDERCLKSHFSKYGKIKSVHLTKDQHKGFCKGFGSVTFEANVDIDLVLSHDHSLLGRSIMCERFIENKKELEMRKDLLTKKRIFISNIPNWMSNDALTHALNRFGRVQMAYRIQKHNTRSQMPYGYVCFEDEGSVKRCLDKAFLFMGEESGFMLFEQYTKDKKERLRKRNKRDKKIRNFKKSMKNDRRRTCIFTNEASFEFGPNSSKRQSNPRMSHDIQFDAHQNQRAIYQGQNSKSGSGVSIFHAQKGKKQSQPGNPKKGSKKFKKQRNRLSKKKDSEILKRQLQFNLLKPTGAEYWKFSLKRTKYFKLSDMGNYRFNKA